MKHQSTDLPRYANLREGHMYCGDEPALTPWRAFLLVAAALTALAFAWAIGPRIAPTDPAARVDAVCQKGC